MPKEEFTIDLDPRSVKHIQRQARLEGRSIDAVVEEAVSDYVNRKERLRKMLLECEAEADKGIFISEEAMTAWIESWDTENELPPPKPDIFRPPRKRGGGSPSSA